MDQQNDGNQSIAKQWGCWSGGCCLLVLFFAGTICGLLFWLLWPDDASATEARKAAEPRQPLAVWLLIDNSNSMFEMGGVGSDPALLRLDAARLFLTYLGIDEPGLTHQAGVIFFGDTAVSTVPLTPLTDDVGARARLLAHIADPPRMGWTDHLAALELAQAQLAAIHPPHRPVIILLTDGKPEWTQMPTAAQQAAYVTALRAKAAELSAAGVSLSIILLANNVTDADPELAALWQPLWQEIATQTPAGRFYIARTAAELPDIYHDMVVTLTERQTEGMVVDTAVATTAQTSLTILPGLAQMTLVISKSSPTQTVQIETPDHIMLADDLPLVRHIGGNGDREEVWVIEQPPSGIWTLHFDGSGRITVWQDYLAAPTSTPPPVVANPIGQSSTPFSSPRPTAMMATVVTTPPLPTATAAKPAALSLVPLDKPNGTLPATNDPNLLWPWLLFGLLFLGVGAAVFYHRQRGNQPLVAGTLQLLSGAQTGTGQTTVDLDNLGRPLLIVGQPPADVPLPGATTQAVIRPGAAITADTYEMRISGHHGKLRLNGHHLNGETTLSDTAVISFGGVEARYENLRLRRAEREMRDVRD